MKIAIVGMSCMFPGAPNLATYYDNLRKGVDSIREATVDRVDREALNAAMTGKPLTCNRGGFIDEFAKFDPLEYGIMPIAVKSTEPDQLLLLKAAYEAIEDAGYAHKDFPRDRTSVVLGRGAYNPAVSSRLEASTTGVAQVLKVLTGLMPDIDRATLERVVREMLEQIDPPSEDGLIGVVPNLAASRIAQKLNLRGPAMCIDAACASSLIAVEQGCRDLAAGRVDMAIAGGVHIVVSDSFWQIFNALGALSETQQIRPLDQRADGLLVGEGLGLVVLKRLEDAERDGDAIYAVLRGIGTSSDGNAATLMSPDTDGQLSAIDRAWQETDLDRSQIGFLEAHGTATAIGDYAELETIARAFGGNDNSESKPVVGSVKSNLGHLMPAAGIAGFIKAVLSVHHGELFPTLHCEQPHKKLSDTRFRVISKTESWDSEDRVAGVNAFGFGGINTHAVIQQHGPARRRIMPVVNLKNAIPSDHIARYSANSKEELIRCVKQGIEREDGGPVRAAMFAPDDARRERLVEIIERGRPWKGRESIWFSENGLISQGGKIAAIFPGVDSSFEPRVEDIARQLGEAMPRLVAPKNVAEKGFFAVNFNRIMLLALQHLNVPVDMFAGHSIGEWNAMMAANMLTEEAFENFRGALDPSKADMPDVFFVSVACGIEQANKIVNGINDLSVSHDNCPHQIILCGPRASIDEATKRLREHSVMCEELGFQSGAHSPYFENFANHYRDKLKSVEFKPYDTPVWSATTCSLYPKTPQEVLDLSIEHLIKPVRFREMIDQMYEEGARVFIQVGTGSLCNFVDDTLRGKQHASILTNTKDRAGVEQIGRMVAELFVEGVDGIDIDMAQAKPDKSKPLSLSAEVAKKFTPLEKSSFSSQSATQIQRPEGVLAEEFDHLLDTINQAQRSIFSAISAQGSGTGLSASPDANRELARESGAPMSWEKTVIMSPETDPQLLDHSLYPQPEGWKEISDTFPIIPLTMLFDMAMEYAVEKFPGKLAIAIEDMYSLKWVEISEETHIKVTGKFDGVDRVEIKIGDTVGCTVVLGDEYPEPPDVNLAELTNSHPSPYNSEQIYEAGLMFHGPAYQGLGEVGPLGDNGIDGTIVVPSGRGSLMDNAGQLVGYWIVEESNMTRMAFPVSVKRIQFFGPEIAEGETVVCKSRSDEVGEDTYADMVLTHNGKVWAFVEDWYDKSLESVPELWSLMREPTKLLIANEFEEGVHCLADVFRSTNAANQLTLRFLGRPERDHIATLISPLEKRRALFRNVIAKDAVRLYLRKPNETDYVFPVEVSIVGDDGRTVIAECRGEKIAVSVAQVGKFYVARVNKDQDVSIEIKFIDDYDDEDYETNLSDSEKQLIAKDDIEIDTMRLLTAKSAIAQLDTDADLIAVDRSANSFLIGDRWVNTSRVENYISAWISYE